MEISDNEGNKIENIGGNLFLRLKGEARSRKIGWIYNGILYVSRIRDKHLHRKSNSYSFNHHIIANAKTFNRVSIRDEKGVYNLKNEEMLDKGEFLFSQEKGFEKQLFVSLDYLESKKLHL